MKPSLVILVPIYKTSFTPYEKASIRQLLSLCHDEVIRWVAPRSLSIPAEYDLPVEYFDDDYFSSIHGYNRLMLSAEFYRRFAEFDYLLICQTDAWLFRNELQQWCEKGYPYIGAPWLIKRKYQGIGRLLLYLRALPKKLTGRPFHPLDLGGKVGNGGLSLRRVQDFIGICEQEKTTIDEWLERSLTCREFNEDCFWATRANWHYPTWQEALTFSFDLDPADAYIQNHEQLPMGCHGWNKPACLSFWKQFIAL